MSETTCSLPPTLGWDGDAVLILDQTLLPDEERVLRLETVDALAEAITRLRVRGAPALGVAGALGVALACVRAAAAGGDVAGAATAAAAQLVATRPTAVNLAWGVAQALEALPAGPHGVVARALTLLDEDIAANTALSERGADLLVSLLGRRPLRLLTHCNAGALACGGVGTALGVVAAVHRRGLAREVFTCETRPLLQGARLTAWELSRLAVPFRVLVDGAGPSLVLSGGVDAVVVGADRIAANGDVANKIGTLSHALAAARAGIPFVVAAPETTVDSATATGADIVVEERDPDEVLTFAGRRTAPAGARAYNPAFDVTPADLVTAVVTDRRVVRVSAGERP